MVELSFIEGTTKLCYICQKANMSIKNESHTLNYEFIKNYSLVE